MHKQEYFQKIGELYNTQQNAKAKELLNEAICKFGQSHDSHFFSGVTAFADKNYSEAVKHLTESNRLNPNDLRVLYNLGVILIKMELYSDAMTWFKKLIQIKPDHIPTLLMISAIFDVTGNPSSNERTCRIILNMDPNNVSALNNLGNACKNSGKPYEAVEAYQHAIKLNPKLNSIRSNLLFSINYVACDPLNLRKDHQTFASLWDNPKWADKAKPLNGRKLRVGVVSPDFCTHSVSYFLYGIYTYLNREDFFLASYGNIEHPDDRTNWFISHSDLWRDINETDEEIAAAMIREDKIDILIDLGGHTGGSNLPIFGLQPAPIQITWLGYPATSGMKTIQYRLTDYLADPPGAEIAYTEKLYRLPHFLNYTHRSDLPDCDFTATEERNHTLFGSFNNIAKLSPETIKLWAAVLKVVPNSQLLIKHKFFNDPGIQELFRQRFRDAGIDQNRLIFHAFNFTDKGHLEEYHQIDIALDSFPYNGTTTTFEAMVMGVPTLTLNGNVHASRVGTTIMSGIGLPEYTATTPEEFINAAKELTSDTYKLLETKRELRERFYASPFADAREFTHNFEKALLNIWEENCE